MQEAHLPFRIDAAPLDGVTFPPVAQTHKAQENTSPPLLVCVRPGRFQANVSLTTDPLKAFAGPPGPTHLEKEGQEGGRPATQTPIATPKPTAADNAPQQPGSGIHPLEVVERIVTIILLIILFAIAAMIVLAEVSGTANTQISHLFHIDIRYEMAYLISLVHQIHLW